MDPLVILYSLFGPFLVWPLEYLLPYPYIIEELFKFVLVFAFPKRSAKTFVLAGVSFALTETILYSMNINAYGSLGLMLTRFVSTSLLHAITFLMIYLANKIDKRLIIIGFFIAVLIHYLYNRYIPSY